MFATWVTTPNNLPSMMVAKGVQVENLVQFRPKVKVRPYPTRSQFLYHLQNPEERFTKFNFTASANDIDEVTEKTLENAINANLNVYSGLKCSDPKAIVEYERVK